VTPGSGRSSLDKDQGPVVSAAAAPFLLQPSSELFFACRRFADKVPEVLAAGPSTA
jgi:hypothetical protein